MCIKVGLTGGIGAGKSTVARIFEVLGTPVYYADERAKYLMANDLYLIQAITNLLGTDAYHSDGTLNRSYVAKQVFPNRNLIEKLNGLVHPAVHRDYNHWHARQSSTYSMEEAALIFESGGFLKMDFVVNVHADQEIRLARVMQRDQATRQQILTRMDNQWPDDRRLLMADYTVVNDGNQSLIRQVLLLHETFANYQSGTVSKVG